MDKSITTTAALDQSAREISTAADQADQATLADTVSDEELEIAAGTQRVCNPTGQLYYSNCS